MSSRFVCVGVGLVRYYKLLSKMSTALVKCKIGVFVMPLVTNSRLNKLGSCKTCGLVILF